MRSRFAVLGFVILTLGTLHAQQPLAAFRDPVSKLWGYKRSDGTLVIPPRYIGAGTFRNGHAPVKDADGFAIIDITGLVAERILTDSVSAMGESVPPPSDACAWSGATAGFSEGFTCYVAQLGRSVPVVGGQLTIDASRGESRRSATILRLPSGVVVVEDHGYEGFMKRVLRPGVTEAQADEWRRKLYPDLPVQMGCSESWRSGRIPGGAFIEQRAGC